MEKRRWTKEEDKVLVQAISASPHNLQKCFLSVAQQLNRTPLGVQLRWYQYVRFSPEGERAVFTISSQSIFPGKTQLKNSRVTPIKVEKNTLWIKLLKILKLK